MKKITKKKTKPDFRQRVDSALDKIRPMLEADGGDIRLVSASEKTGVINVSLLGMCSHCPMAGITLKQGIEAELKKKVKGVKEVRAE